MDNLWTEKDYLSTWFVFRDYDSSLSRSHSRKCRYADPDAELHERYDSSFSVDHRNLVQERAKKRRFSRHTLGSRRPESIASCEMLPVQEEEQEWDDRHITRREELVRSFMISWDNGKAEWLPFPGTK